MSSRHTCKITALKDQYRENFRPPQKGARLFSQNICALQFHDAKNYYKEVCNEGSRAIANSVGHNVGIFDIAVDTSDERPKGIKVALLTIIREKLVNDIVTYNLLIDEMLKDGKITIEEHKEMSVSTHEIANYILTKNNLSRCTP